MCREANNSKLPAGALDYLNRRGLNIVKGVLRSRKGANDHSAIGLQCTARSVKQQSQAEQND